ncbi:hypothetical protein [Vibrio sp. 10N]|uniref:hypothetical protein n=1 Tax=Vibrio sp. 10N TaxID=3058938 RepID=UPI002813FD6E|nr:hypothetical protein VB10N_19230 [Vibrio sp. 10N]
MSLDRVEEQLPLLLTELEAFSSQAKKHIGLLSVQAESFLPDLPEELQMKLQTELLEIEELVSQIANSRCTELSDQLRLRLALIRSYLHE